MATEEEKKAKKAAAAIRAKEKAEKLEALEKQFDSDPQLTTRRLGENTNAFTNRRRQWIDSQWRESMKARLVADGAGVHGGQQAKTDSSTAPRIVPRGYRGDNPDTLVRLTHNGPTDRAFKRPRRSTP